MRLPLCTADDLRAELFDLDALIDVALAAVPVSPDAAVRKRERLDALYAQRRELRAQLTETET